MDDTHDRALDISEAQRAAPADSTAAGAQARITLLQVENTQVRRRHARDVPALAPRFDSPGAARSPTPQVRSHAEQARAQNRELRALLDEALWGDLLHVDASLSALAELPIEDFAPGVRIISGTKEANEEESDGDGFRTRDGRGRFGAVGPFEIGGRELGRGAAGVVYACRLRHDATGGGAFDGGLALAGPLAVKVLSKRPARGQGKLAREVLAT
jgi:hypothetical protein